MGEITEVSQKLIEVTLLGDVVVQAREEREDGTVLEGKCGRRGDVLKLKVGFANMLLSSNLAVLGKDERIKPFVNNKAERIWADECERARLLGKPMPPHPSKATATK